MPARTGYDDVLDRVFAPLRRELGAEDPSPSAGLSIPAPAPGGPVIESGSAVADLEARLRAAVARNAELQARVADLEARNHELAADLDDALDQLSGHALHAEQERLVHPPAWGAWTNTTD